MFTVMNPSGTSIMLALAKVAVKVLVPDKLAFSRVKFPTEVCVPPRVNTVFPNVVLEFCRFALVKLMVTFEAEVTRPLLSTVTWLTVVALP